MKRWLMLFLFLLVLIGPNINWAFINYIEGPTASDSKFSENRNLAELEPLTLENWDYYPSIVEAYINDHAPFRTEIIDFYTQLNLRVFNSITATTNLTQNTRAPQNTKKQETKKAEGETKAQEEKETTKQEQETTIEKQNDENKETSAQTESRFSILKEINNLLNETKETEEKQKITLDGIKNFFLYNNETQSKTSEKETTKPQSETEKDLTSEAQTSTETEEEIREKSSAKRMEEARAKIAEDATSEVDQSAVAKKVAGQQAVLEAKEALETQVLENPKEKIIKETESGNDDLKINLVIQGKENWFFYAGEDSIIDSLGVEPFTDEQHANILDKLIKVRNKYTKENRNFVLFIPPNKERIYSEYLPDQYKNITGTSRVEELVKYIRKNSDINVIYPRKELLDTKSICDVYYKSDTHWNMIGAYVGAQVLVKSLMGDMPPITFHKIKGKPFVVGGDLQQMARIPDSWIDDMYYDIEGITDVNIDATWLEEDENQTGKDLLVAMSNNAQDMRSFTIIRDSYVMNMLPELSTYFSKSTFIHWQEVKNTPKEFFEGSDIFVIEYVERYLRDLEKLLDEILAK